MQCRTLLMQLYSNQGASDKLNALLADSLRIAPNDADLLRFGAPRTTTPENLLSLSLTYYRQGRYTDCIKASQDALRLNPNYAEAYNNIAAAWNAMGNYDEGIRAAEQAVRLKPDFQLARNNLAWAQSQKARVQHP